MRPDVLTRPWWPIICAALAVTLVLAACSGGSSRSAGESESPVPSQSASQAPDDAGREVIIVTRAPGGEISSSVKLVPSGERLDGFMDKERSQPNVIGVMPNATGDLQSSPPDDSAYSKGQKPESKYMPNVGACCSDDVRAAGKGYPGAGTATDFVDGWGGSGGGVWLEGTPLGDVISKVEAGSKQWGDVVRPKIAILDSGIEPLDPELSGPKRRLQAIGDGYDFSGGGDPVRLTMASPLPAGAKRPYDMGAESVTDKEVKTGRHGTKVASIIAAARNNAKTIAGLATEAPNGAAFDSVAQVLPYIITKPVVDKEPVADLNYVTNALGQIINDAAKAPPTVPDIVLMPFKFDSAALQGDAVKLLSGFVNDLTAAGVLVIASAARDGAAAVPPLLDAVAVPAGLPNVLRVGGWGDVIPADPASKGRFPKGTPSSTSPRSPLVDVVAPAKGVMAAYRNPGFLKTGQSEFAEMNGQSASAAMVAAAVALRKGVFQQEPCWKKPDTAAKFGCVNALASGIRETAWKPANPTDPVTGGAAGTAGDYFGSGMLSVPSLLAVPQTVINADDGLDGLAMPIPQIPAGTNTTVTIKDTGNGPSTDPVAPDKVTVDVKVAGLVPGLLPAAAKIKDPVSGAEIPAADFKYRVWVDGKPAAKTQAAFKNNQPNPFDPYTDFTVSGTQQALGVEAVLPTGVLKPVDLLVTLVAPGHGDSFGYHVLCRSKTDDGKKIQSLPARTAILTCSGRKPQTVQITSQPAPGATKVGDTYQVVATATSTLPVTLIIDPASAGVCQIDAAGLVTFNAKGPCVIQADQAGDETFAPASARQSIDVGRQTVTFNPLPPASATVGEQYQPAATATSTLPVTYMVAVDKPDVCELDVATQKVVTFKAKGNCVIIAAQVGNDKWYDGSTQSTVVVVGKPQTVTFNQPPPVTATVDGTYRLAATATSGLPVTYETFTESPGVCEMDVAETVVTFKAKGQCVINADQAGNEQWNASGTQSTVVVVGKAQTITFNQPPLGDLVVGGTYSAAATATSGLPVVYGTDAASASVCWIDAAGLVTFKAKGTCVINADQAGDDQWEPATKFMTVNVVKKP